jgi:hypothetical protein
VTRAVPQVPSAPVSAGPVAAPRVLRQRRVRAGHLGLAVLLVALGGLLAGFAFVTVARTGDYLAVNRQVAIGAVITNADVAIVQIPASPGLKPIPAAEVRRVVGKRAAVTLVPGTLLTYQQLTDQILVGPGQRQVAVGLKPERLPAKRLNPGDQVILVSTAPASQVAGASGTGPATQERFNATVVDSGNVSNDTVTVVYLSVAEFEAARIVNLAAEGRLAMVKATG